MSSRSSSPPPREAPDIETSSEGYAQRFAGEVGGWFLEAQREITRELLAPWRKASILDVGGGHGQLTGALVAAGYDVTIYASPGASRDRVRVWIDRGEARFTTGDLLRIPWGDRSFDLVLAYRLLPHAHEWKALLSELCRLAKCAVLLDYPTRRSLNAFAAWGFPFKKRLEGNTRSFTVFRDAQVKGALVEEGFVVTARRPEFLLPMVLHRRLGALGLSRALERGGAALGLTSLLGSPVILRAERRG